MTTTTLLLLCVAPPHLSASSISNADSVPPIRFNSRAAPTQSRNNKNMLELLRNNYN